MMEAHWKWWIHEVNTEMFLYDWLLEAYTLTKLPK